MIKFVPKSNLTRKPFIPKSGPCKIIPINNEVKKYHQNITDIEIQKAFDDLRESMSNAAKILIHDIHK